MVVLTAPSWNAVMSSVGVAMVRPEPSRLEAPHSVHLGQNGYAVGSAIVSLKSQPSIDVGPLIRALEASELSLLEDRMCAFLRLPSLVGGHVQRPVIPGDPTTYPLWGEIYRAEPVIDGERKRYVVVSPNSWNVVAPYVTVARLTSQVKVDHLAFPEVLGGESRAACGDLTSRSRGTILLPARDRPPQKQVRWTDMSAIGRGIAVTFRLGHALERAGVTPPNGSAYE